MGGRYCTPHVSTNWSSLTEAKAECPYIPKCKQFFKRCNHTGSKYPQYAYCALGVGHIGSSCNEHYTTGRYSFNELINGLMQTVLQMIYSKLLLNKTTASGGYYIGDGNKNCPFTEEIVSTEAECKKAAPRLGLTYTGSFTSSDVPAGCYYYDDYRAKFNTVVDPYATNKARFGRRGGVCKKGKGIISKTCCIHEAKKIYKY